MKTKMFIFKSKTSNGRPAKTRVFMPEKDIVVINQRILAKLSDIKNGWFLRHLPINTYKDYVLMETEMVLWVESFNQIQKAFKELNER